MCKDVKVYKNIYELQKYYIYIYKTYQRNMYLSFLYKNKIFFGKAIFSQMFGSWNLF